ncbi:uncharacterized protein LOC128306019 [Anopheles moucheti]|uniref:uncharacterized protein LOC128306019 n=1 Tax=Anopheles moucheti TaxID=186751 RepID=UPI0022F13BB6|nr:uncharacterized protein LOC128306019 [Anopheles moucheti]
MHPSSDLDERPVCSGSPTRPKKPTPQLAGRSSTGLIAQKKKNDGTVWHRQVQTSAPEHRRTKQIRHLIAIVHNYRPLLQDTVAAFEVELLKKSFQFFPAHRFLITVHPFEELWQ